MPPSYPWIVSRRHYQQNEQYLQTKVAKDYATAVTIAKKWYKSHGINYGIKISYRVPEVWKWVTVRDYYMGIKSEEDIK